ncbi:MAG: choice-of-anchor B family protein [Bacteroidota bacterium]
MRFLPLALALLTGTASAQPCTNGTVTDGSGTTYACDGVDLLARISPQDLGAPPFAQCPSRACLNDIWGWTDEQTGREYALVGVSNGTAFVDVTTPEAPVPIGRLPTATGPSTWRDVKVHANHAYIVSEAANHGVQVFDLRQLRGLSEDASRTFTANARVGRFNAHNIAVDTEAARAYSVGGQCGGGLDIYDLSTPGAPAQLACYSGGGYTHDAQCVTYNGPDADYSGHQICFGFNEDRIEITDVTDPQNILSIANGFYPSPGYTHQGWLTDDGRFLLVNDEGDETFGQSTRTLVMDVEDLDNPGFAFAYEHDTNTVDHNLYVRDGFAYEANYNHGLRILDLAEIGAGALSLAAFFDTFPASLDGVRDDFDGAWSVYPFFESGTLIVSDQVYGLFVLRATALPSGSVEPPVSGGFGLGAVTPNPAGGRARVAVEGVAFGQAVRFTVLDSQGREVAAVVRLAGGVAEVDTSSLAPGVYRLRAVSAGETVSVPVVVAR